MAKNLVKTRIPTDYGEFTLYLYSEHGKEHLALVIGTVADRKGVPVRVHSECLTGDVFGSRRCDCGDQLKHTLQYLGRSACGVLIYLRQEGRGIGLRKKLEAYNLQDQGMDTVEANIYLGHQPDERSYDIAARILRDLQVRSIRLITNNPHKVDELTGQGIEVEARIPIEVGQHADNLDYLRSKAEKMAHLLTFRERPPEHHDFAFIEPLIDQLSLARSAVDAPPFVTLAYVQSLDGCFAVSHSPPETSAASKPALALFEYLRACHDAWLVAASALPTEGVDLGALGDEPPRLVILDLEPDLPNGYPGLASAVPPPIVITRSGSDSSRWQHLAAGAAEIITVAPDPEGDLDLRDALRVLRDRGLRTLMVEGGVKTFGAFFKQHLVNFYVIALTPNIVGKVAANETIQQTGRFSPVALRGCSFQPLGPDLIAFGPTSTR